MTPETREIDAVFRKAEQAVSKGLIKKRSSMRNAYWGRVKDDGTFPLHSGTSIKGVRLNRIHVGNDKGWNTTSQGTYATTKMCEQKVPEVIKHGFEEYFYSPMTRTIRTDWICINELATRDMPAEEILHLEEGMQDAARYVWEEAYRSRYINFCGNKILAKLTQAQVDAGDALGKASRSQIVEDAFVFEDRLDEYGNVDEMDERFIRVNIDPADIDHVADLSFDMLDEAAETLEMEDGNMYALDDGIDLFDVLTCSPRVGRRMAEFESIDMDNAPAYGGRDADLLKKRLGTKFVARNMYSVRHDMHAMRFYPDTRFNATELAAYDADVPATWPRFVRVFAYKPQLSSTAGIKYVPNSDYKFAPFGISVIFTPRVMEAQAFPDISGVSKAKKAGSNLGYAGTASWRNPDWPSNEDREMGYYKMRFGTAIKPHMTEEGYAYFHRLPGAMRLIPETTADPATPYDPDIAAYAYQGTAGSELNEITNENRPIAYGKIY